MKDMKKLRIMTVFGTRPEAIKMAPIVLELNRRQAEFESFVVVTGQHRHMLDQVLGIFGITPDYDLDIMGANQTLGDITTKVLLNLDPVIKEVMPDIVLVHGDTTTTFAASLCAFYNQVAIGHVEAGLRTWDKYSPFPEEMNRQMTDVLGDLFFAPTNESKENLLKENHPAEKIFITGNTAIDALKETVVEDYLHPLLDSFAAEDRIVLVTMHRRENQGEPMKQVFQGIRQVVEEEENVQVVYPVHLNPVVKNLADEVLGNHPRIHLIAPLNVIDFHNFANQSTFIMSDSGGVQEEAPSLGKPVLVLRDTTERPEGIKAGTLKLVGTERQDVYDAMKLLLADENLYKKMSEAQNPYGDGQASQRILEAIQKALRNKPCMLGEF